MKMTSTHHPRSGAPYTVYNLAGPATAPAFRGHAGRSSLLTLPTHAQAREAGTVRAAPSTAYLSAVRENVQFSLGPGAACRAARQTVTRKSTGPQVRRIVSRVCSMGRIAGKRAQQKRCFTVGTVVVEQSNRDAPQEPRQWNVVAANLATWPSVCLSSSPPGTSPCRTRSAEVVRE